MGIFHQIHHPPGTRYSHGKGNPPSAQAPRPPRPRAARPARPHRRALPLSAAARAASSADALRAGRGLRQTGDRRMVPAAWMKGLRGLGEKVFFCVVFSVDFDGLTWLLVDFKGWHGVLVGFNAFWCLQFGFYAWFLKYNDNCGTKNVSGHLVRKKGLRYKFG